MRVLLLHYGDYAQAHSGRDKANRFIIESLATMGHDCKAVIPLTLRASERSPGGLSDKLSPHGSPDTSGQVAILNMNGVEVHAVREDGLSQAIRMSQMRHHICGLIRDFEPDCTIASCADRGLSMLRCARDANAQHIVFLARCTANLGFGPKCYYPTPHASQLLQQVSKVIVNSRYLQEYVRQWAGVESEVLDVPVYGMPNASPMQSADDGFITMVNPCAIKGITIFEELARRLPDQQFAVVPTWGMTREDRSLLEARKNVHFLAPSEDIDQFFCQTSILLVPSLFDEAFGRIVIEAMLRAIPVIASDQGGLPEAKLGVPYTVAVSPILRYLPEFDDRGLPIPVVPAQDMTSWLNAIHELANDRLHYSSLSARSRETALAYVSALSLESLESLLVPPRSASRLTADGFDPRDEPRLTQIESDNQPQPTFERRAALIELLKRHRALRDRD